jgi:hypothetical protein
VSRRSSFCRAVVRHGMSVNTWIHFPRHFLIPRGIIFDRPSRRSKSKESRTACAARLYRVCVDVFSAKPRNISTYFLSRYLNFGARRFNTNREINAATCGRVFAVRHGADGNRSAMPRVKTAPSRRAFTRQHKVNYGCDTNILKYHSHLMDM